MHNKNLSELFTIPKGNLEIAGEFYGNKVYTSDKLKKSYVEAMSQSSKGGPVFKKIEELIEKSIIIPAYKTKSILKSLFKLQPVSLFGIMGCAVPSLKKIYIFVEEGTNIFSFASNEALASVTIHEMIHFVSIINNKFFYKNFLEEFKKFYSFYFCRVFGCDENKIKKEDLEKLCEFIYNIEKGKYKTFVFLKEYETLMKKTFKKHSGLNEEVFDKISHNFVVSIYTIMKADSEGAGNLISRITYHFREIYYPLYVTYKQVFAADLIAEHQLAYQELFTPSEIICTLTLVKSIPSKVYKAIEKI